MTPVGSRGGIITPPPRLASIRYWINFPMDCPLKRCETTLSDLEMIDKEFGSALYSDTEEFYREGLTHPSKHGKKPECTELPVDPQIDPLSIPDVGDVGVRNRDPVAACNPMKAARVATSPPRT